MVMRADSGKESGIPDFNNIEIAFRHVSDGQLKKAWWLFRLMGAGWLMQPLARAGQVAVRMGLPVQGLIRATVFKQFCGGESISDCRHTIEWLGATGVGTILDFAREGGQAEPDLEQTAAETHRNIDYAAENSEHIPFCVFKPTGMVSFDLLEKAGAGTLTEGEKEVYTRGLDRIRQVCRHGAEKGVRVFIDAEESWIQDPVDDLCLELMQRFNRQRPLIYTTLQMYRKDRPGYLEQLAARAREDDFYPGVKFVRGAYLDKERERADRLGLPSPVFDRKDETDRAFDNALRLCFGQPGRFGICAGTHNDQSTRLMVQLMEENGIGRDHPDYTFSQLLGMSDHLTFNLAFHGYQASKYVPYGPVREVLPYLTRRAEENASIRGQVSRELQLITRELRRRAGACGK